MKWKTAQISGCGSLKDDRVQDHVDPAVHFHPAVGGVAVNRIVEAPVFNGNLVLRDGLLLQQLLNRHTSHFGKPLVVFPATNGIGVADQVNVVSVQKVGDGVEPVDKVGGLIIVDVITASSKANAFSDLVRLCPHNGGAEKQYTKDDEPLHRQKLTKKCDGIRMNLS